MLSARMPIIFFWLAGCAWSVDFSGKWFLDVTRSDTHALFLPTAQTLTVSQQDQSIQCDGTYPDGSSRHWAYRLDGAETEGIIVKWEGDAMLVNTQVSGGREYTVMDRWDLSRDGATLTITRQVVVKEGQLEGSLVYMKSPAEAEPRELIKQPPASPSDLVVARGTHIGLALRNALDTKHTQEGDHVYLETIAPIAVAGQIVIPRGSYVNGTVTESKPAKGIKTKGEMYIRFDSLVLPNGVTRDFHSRLVSADASTRGTVDAKEGKVTGERDSSGDAKTVAIGTGVGASVGAIAGSAAGHPLGGTGIGAAAGAAVGLATIFHGKRPEAVLPRGTIVEMVLDRDLTYSRNELPY
jgi:hypothetical protein